MLMAAADWSSTYVAGLPLLCSMMLGVGFEQLGDR